MSVKSHQSNGSGTYTQSVTAISSIKRLTMAIALGVWILMLPAQAEDQSSPQPSPQPSPRAEEPIDLPTDQPLEPIQDQTPDQTPSPIPDPSQDPSQDGPVSKQTETLRIRGKLQTGWEIVGDSNTGAWSDSFYLRRARIDGKWQPFDWAKLVLELEMDLARGLRARDAYGEFELIPGLELTLGNFKKPFSRLRMMSPWDLPVPERGLLDQYVVDDTKYGGFGARDLGLMLHGEGLGPKLFGDKLKANWYLGAFNNLPTENNYHRDLVARGQLRLYKGLVLAANGSFKFYQEANLAKSASMLGGDIKWELGDFLLQLEAATGDNVNSGTRLWGAHLISTYQLSLQPLATWLPALADWHLTPALMLEAFNPDLQAPNDLDLRLAAALNLDLGEQVRLVLALDKVWTDVYASNSALPDPITLRLQTNLRFP